MESKSGPKRSGKHHGTFLVENTKESLLIAGILR